MSCNGWELRLVPLRLSKSAAAAAVLLLWRIALNSLALLIHQKDQGHLLELCWMVDLAE
jgi:hypothetical protein